MPVFNSQTGKVLVQANMSGLILCVDGNSSVIINGKEFNVSRGSLCLVSPFRFIKIISESDDCKWEIICDDKDVFHNVAEHALNAMKNNNMNSPCFNIDERHIAKFIFFVDAIKDKQCMLDSNLDQENIVILQHSITLLKQAAIVDFLTLYILKLPFIPSHKLNTNENVAINFFKTLAKNFSIHRNVDWYAVRANLSTIYFTKIVRQYTGYTPSQLIKYIVIANAKMLLAQPRLSIKEIAARLNFPDQLTFSRYFKSCTGMSPKKYRETEEEKS